jgi:AraC-like DNA-binding protein
MPSFPKNAWRKVFVAPDFGLSGIVMLGRYQIASSLQKLLPHSHRDSIEICFLERGEQTYQVGGRAYRMRGNDQFFTLPGEVHDTANLPQERGILYWIILRLGPSPSILGLAPGPSSHLKRALLKMPTRHFRAHPDCAPLLAQMIELVQPPPRKKTKEKAYRRLRFQALLLHYLALTVEASHLGAKGSATPLIRRVLHYVEKNVSEPVHVPRLAEIARLSESRFKARFRREIGVPPAEFWLRQKIERATLLLKRQSVTETAYDLGFSSSQYFATVFKRYTRVTPSQFHNRSGNDSN